MKKIGLYIHIPFCKQKCKYCDFISFSKCEEYYEEYFKYLIQEIEEKTNEIKEKFNIEINTIYIGGGTPSIIPEKYIDELIKRIKKCFVISKNCEITIEINPGTVNEEKLKKYKEIGINRLSIGLQSTNNKLLKMLGRIHNFNDFEYVYNTARNIGFNNVNVDLMLGLPNQSMQDIEKSVKDILLKNPEHISVYSLIVEENTKMFDLIESGELKLPEEEIERQMYWKVKKILEENGYNHYEISNFAKKGYESKHNLSCWNQEEYLGFGVSAHSYFDNIRYSNIEDIKLYINNYKNGQSIYNIILNETQDKTSMMTEFMLLGLRKIKGVSIKEFKTKFTDNPIYVFRKELNKLCNENLIEIDDDYIKLTSKGLDLANQVWMEFC